jgi:hypothetical protein
MKITSKNYDEIFQAYFFKATQSGVQVCNKVDNTERMDEEGLELVTGYVCDSLFHRIRYGGANFVPVYADISHLDSTQQGFFTTEQEAIDFHRELVLNYINGLNASSLKTNPINVQ